MKVALSSYTGLGAWFVLRLLAEGHDVDYHLSKPEYEGVLSGLIPKPSLAFIDHRRTIQGFGYPSYKGYDLSIFDLTGTPRQADASKLEAPTFGDGSFECTLEDDREAGLEFMEKCGIEVPPYQRFDKIEEAKTFVKKEDKRFVFKPFTPNGQTQDTATTYVSKDAEDMLRNLDNLGKAAKGQPFILQEYIKGTEMSVEGWFNGEEFFLLTGDIEEKKFMNKNKGPNTGCGGNLIFAMHNEMHIYKEGLEKTKALLKEANFRGVIDINTIITADKAYALEWGPRFGYLCCPVLSNMYGFGWGDMLAAVASGKTPEVKWAAPFGAAITISIPPYPTEIRIPSAKDIPVEGLDPENPEDILNCYLYDVKLSKNKKSLVTSGNYGYIGAPMGVGDSIVESFLRLEDMLEKIHVPNMQYRTDIEECTLHKYLQLQTDGWLS